MEEESFQNNFFDTEYLKADLKGRSVRGGAVTMAAQGLKFFLRMGSTVVLARLLTPQDFGLIAMVTAVTGFVVMFKDMGLSMATVQKAEINHGQISTLFWINVVLSLGVMLVTAALAPVIAWFYNEPRLTWITLALAGAFIFSGLTIQHQALLRRQMRFRSLAVVEIISISVGILAAIMAAFNGAGYWSLVIMQLARAIAIAIGVWVACGWRPGLPVRRSGVRKMLAFGGNLTGFNVINYFARNADNLLIGKFWGSGKLGLYAKAYSLLLLPIRQINAPITAVAIPALSSLQNQPERFRSYYLKALSLITFFTMPLAVVLALLSKEIIQIILGPQWVDANRIFRFLAISIFVQPICNTSGWLYIATGRANQMFKWGSLGISCIVASFLIGLPYGAAGVAFSYACTILLWAVPCMYFATRETSITTIDVFKTVSHSLVAALMAGAAVISGKFLLGTSLPLWMGMLLYLLILAAVYLLLVFYIFDKKHFYLSLLSSMKKEPIRSSTPLSREIKRRFFSRAYCGSEKYWIQRYDKGGHSGSGSYGKLAQFKAKILNEFVKSSNVTSVIEYGCGDGSQLKLAEYPNYLGFDVSSSALSLCKDIFSNDRSKNFKLMNNYDGEKADLTLSLDVIYHLVENEVFESYMRRLFDSSVRFVIIYSSNSEEQSQRTAPHVKHRKFTIWIDENAHGWKLIRYVKNRYPYSEDDNDSSFADFYMYEKT